MALKRFLNKETYLRLLLIVPAVALAEPTWLEGAPFCEADRLD
jgi:hypothetical protein